MAKLLARTITHFFPQLKQRLQGIGDPRSISDYSIAEIIFAALAMFVLKQSSRNQMNSRRHDRNMQKNFKALFGFRLPHMDTVDDVVRKLSAEELEQLKVCLVHTLMEKKIFRSCRVDGTFYLVAVDATGVMSASEEDEGTIAKESKNGVVTYSRQVLEAKILGPNGLAVSVASEWITTDQNDTGNKEDCELNAFKRLASKLKSYFPKLPICILGDSLYPSEPFFAICRENQWRFCVVLKDKKLASIWKQVDAALNEAEAKGAVANLIFDNTVVIEWINGIRYRETQLAWIEYLESQADKQLRYVFVTDIDVNHSSVKELIAAGRRRWNLEDAFNTQKNRGYALAHKHSRKSFLAIKNYYTLMQIAHMINQLLALSQHVSRLRDHSKETLQNLWQLILTALSHIEDEGAIWAAGKCRTQYRLT